MIHGKYTAQLPAHREGSGDKVPNLAVIRITEELSKNVNAWVPPRPNETQPLEWAGFKKLFGRL